MAKSKKTGKQPQPKKKNPNAAGNETRLLGKPTGLSKGLETAHGTESPLMKSIITGTRHVILNRLPIQGGKI